ncbi:hypothetical protein IQ06DRAFT_121686 [Phaeosphaeriaceae sp. SRC1lsM3a]|nr:hypothetical protein IQ06DRAFT_121686 [Stagonospora sp. SRC1lsM3a]
MKIKALLPRDNNASISKHGSHGCHLIDANCIFDLSKKDQSIKVDELPAVSNKTPHILRS